MDGRNKLVTAATPELSPGNSNHKSIKGHIMISYSRSNQDVAIQIRDSLLSLGYPVLMDVDNMQSMAKAVESAAVVLVCISQKYKENSKCRMEAEYAQSRRTVIIPLLMERDYRPDEWLGTLVSGKIFYDFSGKYPFESKLKDLLGEISDIYEECDVSPVEELDTERTRQQAVSFSDMKTMSTYKSNKQNSLEKADTKKGHVMISYDWGQQKKVLWIKDQLEVNGYTVWIDVEDMEEDLLTSMAVGVENAHVVLICMSQKYKESKNCKREAVKADRSNKIWIPLIMEKEFILDGWLDIFISDRKFIDFSEKYPLEMKVKELLKELAKCYDKKFEDPIIEPFVNWDIRQQPYNCEHCKGVEFANLYQDVKDH